MFYTIYIFSENVPGVLNTVTNVFTRRSLNIESIDAKPCADIPDVHLYAITTVCEPELVRIVTRQIQKKVDVIAAYAYSTQDEQAHGALFYQHLINRVRRFLAERTLDEVEIMNVQ